jgi:hypothetical protein
VTAPEFLASETADSSLSVTLGVGLAGFILIVFLLLFWRVLRPVAFRAWQSIRS